jgi:hypothetical protein
VVAEQEKVPGWNLMGTTSSPALSYV